MSDSLVHAFTRCAGQSPAAPAVAWRGECWSYGQLETAAASVQAMLERQCVAPGSQVALVMRNSPQYVAAYFGILAAGCVAVPLNVHERANVLALQIDHAQCCALIGDVLHAEWGALVAEVTAATRRVIGLELQPGLHGLGSFIVAMGGEARVLRSPDVKLSTPALIIYTSGTTSRPKGVLLSHGNLLANATAIADYLQITAHDTVLTGLPFHFSYGCSVLNSHLIRGAQLLLEDNLAFPQVVLRRLQDEKVTGFPGVPSTFALLLGRSQLSDFDLSSLRYITQAGGAMPRGQIDKLRQQLPHTQVFIMYGQTEAAARLTYLPPGLLEDKLGSVGQTLPGVRIEVRRDGQVLPPGEVGEICARGPNVMLGYWRDPELTQQVLRDGWLHTGDLGHFDADGYLYIDGRATEMIKVGAFRVSPQEVEEALANLPGVEEVAVTGIADEMLGQAVKAVIVLCQGASLDAMAVKAHCRRLLASYKVPKVVDFVATLPRTASGKVQRFKLA